MASHHTPSNVIHLHRTVALPVKTLDDIVRENGAEAQHREPFTFIPSVNYEPSLLERLGDFLGSDRGISYMLGFGSGALFFCGSLILGLRVLS